MYTSVASMLSTSSRDQVLSKKVIQPAIASSPNYLHVSSSYFANITTRVSCYAAIDNELFLDPGTGSHFCCAQQTGMQRMDGSNCLVEYYLDLMSD
jgi:hypothetical protein